MIKLAKIVQINSANVILKLESDTQCIDCKSRCSDGFLHFLFRKNKDGTIIVEKNSNHIDVGHLSDDKVFFNGEHKIDDVIGMNFDETQLLKLSLVLYGLPIFILFITLIMGYFIFSLFNLNNDLGAVIGMILGMYFAKLIIKINYSRLIPRVNFFK